jgi:branched-chain amino acid transport system permease protein
METTKPVPGVPAAAAEPAGSFDALAALKSAAFSGAVTLGLGFPLLAYDTHPDISNALVVVPRWSWALWAAGLVSVARFLGLLFDARPRAARRPQRLRVPSRSETFVANNIAWFGLAALVAFPLVMLGLLGPNGSLKWINNYGVQILIYVMLGWGLNIVVGLAGLLDLGYVAFYAVGAYSYALLSTTYGLSFWICLPLAGILAAFWGMILGFPVLRLRGDYLAIVTLAFGEIIRIVLINWTDLTNGYAGISGIPRATFFGVPFTDGEGGFASLFGIAYNPIHRTVFLFYLILFLALLTNAVTLRLRRLPVGRAWEALREDEIACRSLGINTVNTKLTAFALGAMFGGFAGSFFAVRQGFVSPESFTFIESATILAVVVLGGMGSQFGVAIAATVLIGGTEVLRELDFIHYVAYDAVIVAAAAALLLVRLVTGRWAGALASGAAILVVGLAALAAVPPLRDAALALPKLDFDPVQYRMLIFGGGMVLMMIWRPRGIIATRSPSIFLKERKAISGAMVKEGHG